MVESRHILSSLRLLSGQDRMRTLTRIRPDLAGPDVDTIVNAANLLTEWNATAAQMITQTELYTPDEDEQP